MPLIVPYKPVETFLFCPNRIRLEKKKIALRAYFKFIFYLNLILGVDL